jgi:hypothetical protein
MEAMRALLRANRAPAELMDTYARPGPPRPQRSLPLRQRPQMETLPRRQTGRMNQGAVIV